MGIYDMFKLSFLMMTTFLSNTNELNNGNKDVGIVYPPTCKRIECPNYDLIHTGNGFQIRRYNSTMWVSTQPIHVLSLVDAGRIAFYQLYDYIQGKNDNEQKMEMTAPVITEVKTKDSFVVSFFIPKQNQATAPSAKGLNLQKWGSTFVAVRQFSGFVKDDDLGVEVEALYASLEGTVWWDAIEKSSHGDTKYIVAQYNSPFEFRNRVNEIWLTFYAEDGLATDFEVYNMFGLDEHDN